MKLKIALVLLIVLCISLFICDCFKCPWRLSKNISLFQCSDTKFAAFKFSSDANILKIFLHVDGGYFFSDGAIEVAMKEYLNGVIKLEDTRIDQVLFAVLAKPYDPMYLEELNNECIRVIVKYNIDYEKSSAFMVYRNNNILLEEQIDLFQEIGCDLFNSNNIFYINGRNYKRDALYGLN